MGQHASPEQWHAPTILLWCHKSEDDNTIVTTVRPGILYT